MGGGTSPAALALLVLLGALGCGAAPSALRASALSPGLASPSAPGPAPSSSPNSYQGLASLRLTGAHEPHAEPELVTARTHTVAPGETLYRIALKHQVSVEQLAAANGLIDPRAITVGQELVLPGPLRPAPAGPAPGAESPRASRPPVASAPARPSGAAPPPGRAPPAPSSKPVPETKGLLEWPLRGVLYARFGKKGREPHDGIDLAAPAGTLVKAAQEGSVLYAGEQRGYGLIVIVQHSERLITLYAHNHELRVSTGEKVRRGQPLATVGESGKTSGPQLHFEVRVDGKPVDPLDYLGALPSA